MELLAPGEEVGGWRDAVCVERRRHGETVKRVYSAMLSPKDFAQRG